MRNKKFYLALTICLALVAGVFAQQKDPVDRGIDNYLVALNSKNEGLVESAMINIIKLKMQFPERDYSKIISRLDQLTQPAFSTFIRYEAFVVLNYLQYPDRFNWIQTDDMQQMDNLLATLVLKIHEQTDPLR